MDLLISELVRSPLAILIYIEKVNVDLGSIDILFPTS
jgi:hypothetical protein